MKIKKFRGKSILDALSQVKKEFGEEAVILSSEKIRTEEGNFFEITAAIEEDEVEISVPEAKEIKVEEKEESSIKKDLQEIKNMLKKVLSPQLKNEEYIRLLEKGVPAFVAKQLVEKDLTLEDYISKKLKEKGSVPNSKYQVFIGDSGSGKTTNIFKLAVWYQARYNASVLVLSLDTYKVGGMLQAKRFAELLELDFDILSLEDFKEVGGSFTKYDYILIDTPGLDTKFGEADLEELSMQMPYLRFIWVFKATEHHEYGLRIWKIMERLPVDGIFLTFTDKVKSGLPILWLLDHNLPPITFVSTGNRIPEDILRGEEEVLKKLFLRGID